jgi:HK97 family phage major capsid protein
MKALIEKRAQLVSELRSFIDTAGVETEWSQETVDTINRFNADIDSVEQRLDAARRANERVADETEASNRSTPAVTAGDDGVEERLRSFLAGDPTVRSITLNARDLTVGTGSAGGDTVATDFYASLVEHMIESSAILRSGATVLRTTSGNPMQVPTTTTHPSAVLVGEGAAITESDPVFAQRTLNAFKYGVLNQVSNELVTDTSVDLLGYLARACGRAVGNAFGAHAMVGDGSAKPNGLVTAATVGKTGGTGVGGAFTADDLIDLYYSVIDSYRSDPSATWMLRDASIATMRKLKDDAGQYLWNPGTVAGTVDTFLGKPVISDPNIAAIATAAKSVVFGATSAYFVRMVNEIRFERSDEYAFNTDLVTFRCLVRMDGELIDQTGAVKVFQGGAS